MTPGTAPVDAGERVEGAADARSKSPVHAHRTEYCEACADETPHAVRVELRTESGKRKNREFSREPYRVAVCEACGAEATTRMNNA